MIDVILYHDGLATTTDMMLDALTRNEMLFQQLSLDENGVRIIFYSLDTAEHNQVVMNYIDQAGWGYDVILTPQLVLNEYIVFEPGKVLEARGLWNLIHAIKAPKVLFLRVPTRVISNEPGKIDFEDIDEFDLTGTIVNAKKFKLLIHDITYPGYLTSDMIYFLLSMVPGYCEEKKYEVAKLPKVHHMASLVDFYTHIDATYAPYHKIKDRRDLLKKLRDN
jgi:hypothetical protein